MNLVTYLREDVARWVLGEGSTVAHASMVPLIDNAFRAVMRQGLERYDTHRWHQAPLWKRLQTNQGSITAPIWAAANQRVVRAGYASLRHDAHADELRERWETLKDQWPPPVQAALDDSPADLRALIAGLPAILASHAYMALAGLTIPEGLDDQQLAEAASHTRAALPHSIREDEVALGRVLRRALYVAVALGELDPSIYDARPEWPDEGATEDALYRAASTSMAALMSARVRGDTLNERHSIAALEPALRALGLEMQSDCLCAHGAAAAARAGEGDEAAAWLSHLARLAEDRGDTRSALRLHRLAANNARSDEVHGAALRLAAQRALELDEIGEALSLLRDEASLQDTAGQVKLAGLAWLNLAKLHFNLHNDQDAAAAAEEARGRLAEVGTLGMARQALVVRAESLERLGRHQEAIRCFHDAISFAEREEEHEVAAALRRRVESAELS